MIFSNRVEGKDVLGEFDIVIGQMADGKIARLVGDVKRNRLTKTQFIDEISHDIGRQVVFKSLTAIKRLVYVKKEDF